MKCHSVFHISLFKPAADDTYPGQNMEPLLLVKIDGEDEYFIEAILNSRIHWWNLKYLIKWVSYDQPDWEPAELYSKSEAIDTFHEKYPNKLGPLSTWLLNITSPELSPSRGILSWPDIAKSTIYNIIIESHAKL
jgi:hypothetical protein